MINDDVLLSESMTEHRLGLCKLEPGDVRERLIRSFDRFCGLTEIDKKQQKINKLENVVEELEDEKGDFERQVEGLEEQIKELDCDAKKILRHLQESIGIAICLAEKEEHRTRLHGDFDVLELYLSGQIEFDQLKYPLLQKKGADDAA